MVICPERVADFHIAQLMPLPLTVSCFSKILTCFTFLVLACLGSPGLRAIMIISVCVTGLLAGWQERHTTHNTDSSNLKGFPERLLGNPISISPAVAIENKPINNIKTSKYLF